MCAPTRKVVSARGYALSGGKIIDCSINGAEITCEKSKIMSLTPPLSQFKVERAKTVTTCK